MRVLVAGLEEAEGWDLVETIGDLAGDARVLSGLVGLEDKVARFRPHVLGLALGMRPGQVLRRVQQIRVEFPATRVMALSHYATSDLVKAARDAGCADLVLLGGDTGEFRSAVLTMAERMPGGTGRVVAVLGAKGGVGATVIATNLAAALSSRSARVALVDLQLYLGGVTVLLDTPPEPSLLWYLRNAGSLGPDELSGAPRHATGFHVFGLDGDMSSAEAVTAGQVEHLLTSLRDPFDVILVDCGSALGEETLAASFSADRRLMVVTEELPAWIGARRRIGALRSLHIADPIAELVVNRHHPGHPASAEAIEKAVGVPVLGHVRNAWQDVHGALQERMVLAQVAPRSLAAVDIASLAELLAVPTRRTGWGRIAAAVGR